MKYEIFHSEKVSNQSAATVLSSFIVKERILSEQIFIAESLICIGSNLIVLALFGSGSRVEVD